MVVCNTPTDRLNDQEGGLYCLISFLLVRGSGLRVPEERKKRRSS